jgi:subtilisin family serine protease
VLALAIVLLLSALPGMAQPRDIRPLTTDELAQIEQDKRYEPKVAGPLRDLIPAAPGRQRLARDRVPVALERDGLIPITVYTSSPGEALAVLASLSRPTAHVIENVIEVYVAPDEVPQLSGLSTVLRLMLIEPPQPQAVTSYGSTVSQGRDVHNAKSWHDRGYTGAGVKVGVIDTGFYGLQAILDYGELPVPVAVRCYTAVGSYVSTVSQCEYVSTVAGGHTSDDTHGTAVAESLVDVAPGVQLYLARPYSPGDFRNAVDWMVSQGVKVINHSVAWNWDGPGDGSSHYATSPLKSVDAAVAGGAVFVASAGNQRKSTYSNIYSDADADGLLDFAPYGFDSIAFHKSAGQTINLQLRWKGDWPGTSRDLGLILRGPDWSVVKIADVPQDGTQGSTPTELLTHTATVSGEYYLQVRRNYALTAPDWIQIRDLAPGSEFGSTSFPGQYTDGGAISSPADSASTGALAVGAAPYFNTSTIESFSSRGPTPDGRYKPDIVGADRADTLVKGPGAFAGTSQASPHVAGLAALVRGAFPTLTPEGVVFYLKTFARPRGTVPNNTWGLRLRLAPQLCPNNFSNICDHRGCRRVSQCRSHCRIRVPVDYPDKRGMAVHLTELRRL